MSTSSSRRTRSSSMATMMPRAQDLRWRSTATDYSGTSVKRTSSYVSRETTSMSSRPPMARSTTRSTSTAAMIIHLLASALATTPSLFQLTGAPMVSTLDPSAVPMSYYSSTVRLTSKIPTVHPTLLEPFGPQTMPSLDGLLKVSSLLVPMEPTSITLTSLMTVASLPPVMTGTV